jgi:hypothetical protein
MYEREQGLLKFDSRSFQTALFLLSPLFSSLLGKAADYLRGKRDVTVTAVFLALYTEREQETSPMLLGQLMEQESTSRYWSS